MWAFFSRRLRMWLLLAIALPLIQALVHRLALAAERHDPSTRTARTLLQADSAVGAVSRRAARRQTRRQERRKAAHLRQCQPSEDLVAVVEQVRQI